MFHNIISILTQKEKQKFFLLMVFSLLVSAADILSLAFLFFVVNFYTPQHSQINLPFLSHWGIKEHSFLPALLLIIIFICKSIGAYYFYKTQYRFVYHVASRISSRNLLLYLEGGYADHVHIDSAVLIRKISHQPIEFAHYVLSGIQQMITEAILILLTVIALLIIDARLLLIISLVLLPAIVILRYVTKKRLSVIRKNAKIASENTLQYLNEALSGFIESNIYDKNEMFINRYARFQNALNTYLADLQITQGVPSRFFEVFAVFGLFMLIVASEFTGAAKIAGLFTLGAFAAAAYKIIPGISKIINLNSQVKTYEYTVNDLMEELSKTSGSKTGFNSETLNSIEFKNVCFSYKNDSLLSCINFKINNGTFIGISGNSGKGKTTLINLLLGFLSPEKGDILFNGKLRETAERRLFWNKIAYVKQEPFIVHDSVLNNITLFENDIDRERLNNVTYATGLKAFIDQFPEGIEKIITEDGKNISGGQRQRIAIARALYKHADVIILDEPFNELDEASEMNLVHYFKSLSETGKITILITHNTESLSFCNSVITLAE
jgi:ABC-type multidrug transport system fused ATPase/permease subunit